MINMRNLIEDDSIIIHSMPIDIKPNVVYLTDDKEFMAKYISEIYDMFVQGYADKGGMIIDSKEKLLSDINLMKIVFSNSLDVLACFTYKYFAGGKKLFLGAARKTPEGKHAIQEIIKSDIEPYDNWFWGEVSGPIEHYFKKHNGRPIPKELVHLFVGTKRNITPSPDPNDPVHYTRKIGNLSNPIEKSMYGFKNEEMAKAVIESIDNYEEFRLSANALPDKLNESLNNYLEDALVIVMELTELHEELKFNEMLPHWNKQLDLAIKYMEENVSHIKDQNKKLQVKSSIQQGKILKRDMPLLQLHQFHA